MLTECSENALCKVIKNMNIRTCNYKLLGAVWTKDLRAAAFVLSFFLFSEAHEFMLNYIVPDQAAA